MQVAIDEVIAAKEKAEEALIAHMKEQSEKMSDEAKKANEEVERALKFKGNA